MAESAVLDSLAPSQVESPNPSEMVAPESFDQVAPAAELEEQESQETELIEEIGEDDPRAARLLAEQQRRREQALKDQREALTKEREQAEQRARLEAQVQWERYQASEQGKAARKDTFKQAVSKVLEAEDIDTAASTEWDTLEATVMAAAKREALTGMHDLALSYMTEKYGQFYMPNEMIPFYNQAHATGDARVMAGLTLEAVRTLAYREGVVAAQRAMAEGAKAEETADQKAERLRQERAVATAPGAAPVRPVAGTRAPAPKPLSSLMPGTPEYRAAYRQKHGIDPPF